MATSNSHPHRLSYGIWAPRYAHIGIPTFPVNGKKPLIRGYASVDTERSLTLAANEKFAAASIGMMCGPKSGITIIDIDAEGEAPLKSALQRFGNTPLIVKTHSGKHHLYYRYNGESRRIHINGEEIDMLGAGGFAVVPPSCGQHGQYKFARGGLEILRTRSTLPTICSDAIHSIDSLRNSASPVQSDQGHRDKSLFDACRNRAASVSNYEALEAFALFENSKFNPPLTNAHATQKARQIWKYKVEGKLLISGGEPQILIGRACVERFLGKAVAFQLLSFLQIHHGGQPGKQFAIGQQSVSIRLRIGVVALRKAIQTLLDEEYLVLTKQGGSRKGDASQYMLTTQPLRSPTISRSASM